MYQTKVIAIDTGNWSVKTKTHAFPACLIESSHIQGMGNDTLLYEGREYAVADRYLPPRNDKHGDERYFLLSLIAIGRELTGSAGTAINLNECVDVVLLAGLPPLHLRTMSGNFASYFTDRDTPICFALNGIPFKIRFKEAHIFPQGYAGVATVLEQFKDVRTINVADIGGHTVDLLRLIGFRPDMSAVNSIYMGTGNLYQRINERVRAKGLDNIPNSVIEGVLTGDPKVLIDASPERVDLINGCASGFARELLLEISRHGFDLAENRTVFIGGGSILLKEHIEKSKLASKPFFVWDIHANARGYHLLYENRKAGRVQQ